MTSNVGAEELSRRRPGFAGADAAPNDDARAFERTFSPEFRNRLDARIAFAPLSPPVMERIVDRMVDEVRGRLAAKGVRLSLSDAARAWLAERGLDPLMGARPLARLVQEELLRPLGDEILFGALENGGTVAVEVRDGALSLACSAEGGEPVAPSDPGDREAGTPRPQGSAAEA
jgi:ATP-dependent Clp protease ATP-binding subunit ClpA